MHFYYEKNVSTNYPINQKTSEMTAQETRWLSDSSGGFSTGIVECGSGVMATIRMFAIFQSKDSSNLKFGNFGDLENVAK